jgi:hypothetical protein
MRNLPDSKSLQTTKHTKDKVFHPLRAFVVKSSFGFGFIEEE